MQKKRAIDPALVDSITDGLLDAMPMFPKKLLQTDTLQRTHHMPLSHLQIMLMLRQEDMSIGQISRLLGIAKPNITPLVDALCEQGLVERIRDAHDRRVINICLTAAGHTRISEVESTLAGCVTQWSDKLSRSELREMNNALASLLRILSLLEKDA
ncbi:MAG: winged helix-turn-helix transcriptional regulator [Clostridia bacterium]|nr:winged helix-turn-helix transcriptional regulator [Clostridia bacterium]